MAKILNNDKNLRDNKGIFLGDQKMKELSLYNLIIKEEQNVNKFEVKIKRATKLSLYDYETGELLTTNDTLTDWGDGTIDNEVSHQYSVGTYTIKTKHLIVGTSTTYMTIKILQLDHRITDMEQVNKVMASHRTKAATIIGYEYLGDNITNFKNAFKTCTGLKAESCGKIFDDIEDLDNTFYGCTSLTSTPKLPKNVKKLTGTFDQCAKLTTVEKLPESVKSLNATFRGCKLLTEPIEIPEGVENLDFTFSDCTSLTAMSKLPKNLVSFKGAYQNCSQFTEIPELPETVNDISYAFSGWSGLTNVPVFNDNITKMAYTFENCTSLTETPQIKDTVTDIEGIFKGCTKLTALPNIPLILHH